MPLGLEVPMTAAALPAPNAGAAALMGGTPAGAIANLGMASLSKPAPSPTATSGSGLNDSSRRTDTSSRAFANGFMQQTDRSVNFGDRGASSLTATQTPTASAAAGGVPVWVWVAGAAALVLAFILGRR